MVAHIAVIALQFLVCILSAAGWGYWIYFSCGRPRDSGLTAQLLCVVAGACAEWLVLQDALIVGATLRWSAPCGAAVALAGLVGWAKHYSLIGATDRLRLRSAGILLGIVFAFQGAGLLAVGPRDYYGYARQDQVNYVQLAQFLVEQPYSLTSAQVGLHPWLVKGIDTKTQRIGQSVANGYLAAVTGADASQAYGTVSVFFIALIAVCVSGCLLAYGVAPPLAWLGGAWAGVLPALTQMHLDGFLSQASTVFCFVGIAWALRLAQFQPRLAVVTTALFLGFLLSAYSEEYILGLGLALALVATAPGLTARQKGRQALLVTLVPWVGLAPFAGGLLEFIRAQYRSAQHAEALALWHPRAGTWRGWNELFLAAPAHSTLLLAAAAGLGGVLLGFAAMGAFGSAVSGRGLISAGWKRRPAASALKLGSGSAPGSAQRWVLALFPTTVLGALVVGSRPAFPTYAFGKLCVSFSPLFVILMVLGLSWPIAQRFRAQAWLLPALIGFAAWSSLTKLAVVWQNGGGLPTMNTPASRAVYRELEAHPERTYLITEHHGMLNAWFAYHARHAKVYSAVGIGDSAMNPAYEFLQPPPAGIELWEVSNAGVTRLRP